MTLAHTFPQTSLLEGFVYLHSIHPDIRISNRYHSQDNFLGRPFPHYFNNVLILSTQAAKALLHVQETVSKDGFDLVAYTDDQWSVTTGVGRKLNEHWAGNVSVGWDSGAGNPVTTLGPTEGYWNVGLGLQYSPAANYFIAGGVKYFWLGDAQAQPGSAFGTSNYVAEFSDNHALAYGMKIGYRF